MDHLRDINLTTDTMDFQKLAGEYKSELLDSVLPFWLEHSQDKQYGGYFTCLERDGSVYDTDKFIWLQGREVWLFSMLYNKVEKRPEWLECALQGAEFLKKYGHDGNYNWYFSLTRDGRPLVDPYNIFSYTFATMAFAQLAIASGDAGYAAIAKKTFDRVLEKRSNPKGKWCKAHPGTRPIKDFALPMILCNLALEIEEFIDPQLIDRTIDECLHEVLDVSDRVAVLRHGQFVGDMLTKDTDAQEMTNMMVGHAVTLNIDRPDPVDPKPRIEVKNLTVRSIDGIVKLDDVSFTANSGEILGIAGISGCGQKELLEAIAGLQPTEGGSICYVDDDGTREELLGKDPLRIAEMGVALSFVPEDRLGMGLVGNMDLSDNMMLRSFRKGRGILTDRKSPRKLAETVVEELDVNTPGVSTPVRRLSGGNVQKVLVGREIASAPTVLLTAYAVRGLDINASYTIYDLINRQKERGVAVIYVGEDLDVLLELADRILVLCGGKVSGIVPGRGATKRDVGMMMTQLGGNEAHAE